MFQQFCLRLQLLLTTQLKIDTGVEIFERSTALTTAAIIKHIGYIFKNVQRLKIMQVSWLSDCNLLHEVKMKGKRDTGSI